VAAFPILPIVEVQCEAANNELIHIAVETEELDASCSQ
jgi:hypothetical protein